MTPAQQREVAEVSRALRRSTGSDLAVVTLPSLPSGVRTPKAAATQLFNAWGLGDPGKNNGVLVLLTTSERRLEVEVGTGLNKAYAEGRRGAKLQEDYVVPELKAGREGAAMVAAAQRYASFVRGVDAAQGYGGGGGSGDVDGATVGACVAAAAVALGGALAAARGRACDAELARRVEKALGTGAAGAAVKVREAEDDELTDAELTERRVGAVRHFVWAGPGGEEGVAGRPRLLSPYSACCSCGAWAELTESEEVRPATEWSEGLRISQDVCLHCGAAGPVRETVIARVRRDERSSSDNDTGGGSSSGGGSGSSY